MPKRALFFARAAVLLGIVCMWFYAQSRSLEFGPERIPAQENLEALFYSASHPAGKSWTQSDLLERAKNLSKENTKIRVDVFRVFEERDNDGKLLDRQAVFPEIQFYSDRKESHSKVYEPTPIEFMAVWVNDHLEFVFAISSATYRKRFVPARDQWEHPTTPNGSFAPIYLNPLHHSRTYRPVGADIGPEMPFSVFIDTADKDLLKSWSGYAFHGTTFSHYDALGTPDSGGCIRLAREDAEVFFALLNPKLKIMNRYGRWYAHNDSRNRPNAELVDLRERVEINIIDPAYMQENPSFASEIYARYESLISFIYIEVNNNVQRTHETLRLKKYRTLTEHAEEIEAN
jgi:hypothetical protein